ncbi:MAG TPA: methylenetetrahydrofolate reductase [NAD(P)H] [Planctomycetota bacterium]|jgi:methylenetetrahydrofolate reductase (NADPH)|nr:methylenetetrahydrofolate reductase [NAD(P)H] [Planctomycetota bacterium]
MRFADFLATRQGPVISFEVFPPKTEKAYEQLLGALPRLIAIRPKLMTVTYGAMGSTQARTLEIAALIRSKYAVETAAHLTCVGASRGEIDQILDRLTASGIENIVALRGDPPQGETRFSPPPGGFGHANELVAHIRATGRFGIAVAGYPEKHVEAPDLPTDLRNLQRKVEAGADVVITQLFYDNEDFFRFEKSLRALDVKAPIVPGLLPIQSFAQIRRITSLCGAKIPPALYAELELAGDDEAKIEEIGVRWTVDQCRELLARGVPGIHFYVLNRATHMEKIFSRLG